MAVNLPDDLDLFGRFACYGSEHGIFNVMRKNYKKNHAEFLKHVLKERGHHVVKRLQTIVTRKSYARKENMLFSLAATISTFGVDGNEHSTDPVCKEAYKLVESLCESPSDLFNFVHFDKMMRGNKMSWGRGMRTLVSNFYSNKSPDVLAHQITQCKSGHGFNHRDLLKLSHLPCDKNLPRGTRLVLSYAIRGRKVLEKEAEKQESSSGGFEKAMSILQSVEQLRRTQDIEPEVIRSLIETNNLVDKQIPTHFFHLPQVFEGLIGHMPLTSIMNNLHRMAELGLLDERTVDAENIIERLKDPNVLVEERVSPVTVFAALRKYDINQDKKWVRNVQVTHALRAAYEIALRNQPRTKKRYLLACHIEDRTVSKLCVAGNSCMSPIIPCIIFAQILARRETRPTLAYYKQNSAQELSLTPKMTMVQVLEQILKHTRDGGNADYDLCDPLKWATEHKKKYDCILIVAGKKKLTSQDDLRAAIRHYREESEITNAKVVVLGLQGSESYPDRDDVNYLDVTGFDEDVLQLVQQFCTGMPGDDEDAQLEQSSTEDEEEEIFD